VTPLLDPMTPKQKRELSKLLLECATMQHHDQRDAVIDYLPMEIKANIKRNDADNFDVANIVDTCVRFDNGLEELIDSLHFFERNSLAMQAVLKFQAEFNAPPPPPPIITPPTVIPPRPKIEFDWVTIPAGEFTMGSNDYDDSEKPVHKVYLPEYQIARVPITNEQWSIFLQDSGYQCAANRNQLWQNGLPRGKEKHPVVYVTWHDCMAFCQWAGVRLPTEAEWEKAARGTDGRKWPWGNNEPTVSLCNFNQNVDDTTPVGNYPLGKSPYGCLDMAGNVWEWCSSEYKAYPYKAGDGREDLLSNSNKILRGGSWYDDGDDTRVMVRTGDETIYWDDLIGTRCVR